MKTAEVRRMQLADLRPASDNPRVDLRPGDPRYEALRRSMERWGLVETLVWNQRSGNLVGGHQRLKVLLAAGVAEADVSVVDLPADEERGLNVALNNPRLAGEYDEVSLSAVLRDLHSNEFDITAAGFNVSQLGEMLASLGQGVPLAPEPGSGREVDGNLCTCPKCGFTWQP